MTQTHLARSLLRCLCILALLSSAACEHMAKKPSTATIKYSETWQASGKLAVRFDGQNKTANFNWVNRAEDYDIALFGFLGLGNAAIKKRADKVTLEAKDGNFSASSAEDLMLQQLGWSIPVSDLRYWIKGLPSPHSTASEQSFYPGGHTKTLQQNTWQLTFEYEDETTHSLPQKIQALHPQMRLTLIIKSWEL